jgi:hypothetical protein
MEGPKNRARGPSDLKRQTKRQPRLKPGLSSQGPSGRHAVRAQRDTRLGTQRDTPSRNVPMPIRPGAIDISLDVKLGIFRSKSKLVVRFQALKPGLGVLLRLERVLRNCQRFF